MHKSLQGQLAQDPWVLQTVQGFTNAVPLKSAVADIIRGGVTAGEASNNSCATQSGNFISDFCGSQKRWGLPPNNRSKIPKQICGVGTL